MYMRAIQPIQLDNASVSSTAAGTEVDLQKYYISPGKREMKAILAPTSAGVASDAGGTLAYKLQESNTTVDSDFSDISGASFTTVVDSDTNSLAQIHFFTAKRFVRGYRTVTGTQAWFTHAAIFAVKRDA